MEIDEHGWLQENARDTPTPPTQPLVGPSRGSTAFAGSGKGQHRFIVLTRVRQTRTGLRTDGHHRDRPSVADADEHPCQTPHHGVSPASPLRGGQAARLPAPEQIRAAAQEEHREEQRRDLRECRRRGRHHFHGACRRTVQVTKPGTARREAADLKRVLRAHFQVVDHHTAHFPYLPSLSTRRRRSRLSGRPELIALGPGHSVSQTSRRASGPASWAMRPVGAAVGGPCR